MLLWEAERINKQEQKKSCFVIAPIGPLDSLTRLRSNQVLRHIIEPVVAEFGYEKPTRADQIAEPGMIPNQIIEHLLVDDLVVADLTGHNPNVFYELAIRHAERRAVVLLIAEDENPPFDVSQSRAIKFDYRDLDSVEECKAELARQINYLQENPNNVFSPVSQAVDLKAWKESGDPEANRHARIISMIEALQADVTRLESRIGRQQIASTSPASGARIPTAIREAQQDYLAALQKTEEARRQIAEQQAAIDEAQRASAADVKKAQERIAEQRHGSLGPQHREEGEEKG
jgi:hypothetical protein